MENVPIIAWFPLCRSITFFEMRAKIIEWSCNIFRHRAWLCMFFLHFRHVQSVSFVFRHCLHSIWALFLAYSIVCVCLCSAWSFIYLYDRVMFFSFLCPKAVFLVEPIHFQWTSFTLIEFYSNPLNFIQIGSWLYSFHCFP